MSAEINNEALIQAHNYISQIRNNLESCNRFFADDNFLSFLKIIFEEAEEIIPANKTFFRARSIAWDKIDETKKGSVFEGFDAEKSFVNFSSSWPLYGRMNPQGINVLYVASDARTAITELHPYFEQIYSLATINTKDDLRIVNLSKSASSIKDDFTRNLAIYVQEWISQGNGEKDYVFPQYVSSFCKHLGYDGLGYRSKYATRNNVKKGEGVNYTIFNYDKCEVISSELRKIDNVTVQISRFYDEN